MKKFIVASLLAASAITAMATDGEWVDIAAGSGIQWSLQAGSFNRSVNDAGAKIFIGIGRGYESATNKNEVFQMYVRLSDCKARRGQFVSLNLAGQVVNQFDYVIGQGSVAAVIAENICATDLVQNPPKKVTKPAKVV